jgi:cytochrome c oxidase subunit 4
MNHEITPAKTYYLVFVTLLILTFTTARVAYIDLGPFNVYVAMTIAIIKALLVVLFFMHVKQSSHVVKVFVAAGFFWLAIMLSLTLADYLTRGWVPPGPTYPQ